MFAGLFRHSNFSNHYLLYYITKFIAGESPPSGANPTMANSTVNNMGSIQSVNIDAMLRYTFVPDYSVRAVTEVMYLRVKRSFYMAAKRATLMERSKKMSNAGEFDEEVDKVIKF